MSDNERYSWDEYFLDIAATVAKRSTCEREKVGAVLAHENHIVSTGYNGTPSGSPHCNTGFCLRWEGKLKREEDSQCGAISACVNAILLADNGTELYTNEVPSFHTAQLIVQSGVKELVVDTSATVGHDKWEHICSYLRTSGVLTRTFTK